MRKVAKEHNKGIKEMIFKCSNFLANGMSSSINAEFQYSFGITYSPTTQKMPSICEE